MKNLMPILIAVVWLYAGVIYGFKNGEIVYVFNSIFQDSSIQLTKPAVIKNCLFIGVDAPYEINGKLYYSDESAMKALKD